MEASKNQSNGRWSLNGVEPSDITFKRMLFMLDEKENFKFARYGDGEFLCMAGKIGRNCDKHEYFADLGQALNDAFYSKPKYMVGIQPLSVEGGLYWRALQFGPGPENIYDADVLHSASIDGKLQQFLDVLKTRRTVMVGPGYLMGKQLTAKHVLIPDLNCWMNYEGIMYRLKREIQPNDVVLLCASMMSEVIIHELRREPITVIDCGSVFDPLAGKLTRSYHHKLKLNA